jgi:hypothetical protein
MTRIIAAAALLAAVSSAAVADLVITEVAPQTTSGTASTINGDWWELTNTGVATVNLSGYQWADTEDALPSSDSNFFPSFDLAPGQSVIILEENVVSEVEWRTNWGIPASVAILCQDEMLDDSTPEGDTFSGLGNSNDGVFFYDAAGTQLSSYTYASNTRGVSFEADFAGANLGLSVVGENGAVLAANGDIGSPGSAVPSPAALSVMGLAALVAGRRRR